jgi:hypothetical protein
MMPPYPAVFGYGQLTTREMKTENILSRSIIVGERKGKVGERKGMAITGPEK